jgi:hypothetical protein
MGIAKLLAAVSIGVAMAGTATGVASADTPCPANSVCFYEHQNYDGKMLVIPAGTSYGELRDLPCDGCRSSKHSGSNGTWGDMMSSWRNNSNTNYCWYWDTNFAGYVERMPINGYSAYVGKNSNDQATGVAPGTSRTRTK